MLFFVLNLSGCYYGHLASGQMKLAWRRQPIAEALADPTHSERVRGLLRVVKPVRRFALKLGLNVDDQYTSFVDWPGDRVVTTIVRTRPGSLEAVPHWFPIVGELPYKGYFDRDWAEAEATRLRDEEGFDVCVSAISAYSTLGWFADPVTTPMLERGVVSLVETMLHELVHATAFLPGEADFNESVAQFIGQQAAVLFFEQTFERPPIALPDAQRVRDGIADRQAISRIVLDFRNQVIEIQGAANRGELRGAMEATARKKLAALPLRAFDAETVAADARLSDACLALRGTYVEDLPRHAQVLAALDGDLEAMIERLSEWAEFERSGETFFDVIQPKLAQDNR
jgi:predicted aminopeptidase